MNPRLNLAGKTFGRLTVLRDVTPAGSKASLWECQCACGTTTIKNGSRIKRGAVASCGCIHRERMHNRGTHFHSINGAESPTWNSWKAMHSRCTPTHKSHRYYYDKGIVVCKRWKKFENFLADMGERPEGTTLDRKKNAVGYNKRNCQWSTRSQQQMNKTTTKRFTYEGETKTLTAWARDARCRVPYCTLHKRVIVYGFDFILSLTTRTRLCKK